MYSMLSSVIKIVSRERSTLFVISRDCGPSNCCIPQLQYPANVRYPVVDSRTTNIAS